MESTNQEELARKQRTQEVLKMIAQTKNDVSKTHELFDEVQDQWTKVFSKQLDKIGKGMDNFDDQASGVKQDKTKNYQQMNL